MSLIYSATVGFLEGFLVMSAAIVFRKVFSKKNLTAIYANRISFSRAIGIDRKRPDRYRLELKEEVKLINERIKTGTYGFTAYKQNLISKGANSYPRVISIPTVRDRLALRALCDLFAEVYPEAVSEIPQIKIERLKEALSSEKYSEYVKIDLCQFYPSISHKRLLSVLKRRIRKPELLNLIEKAVSTPTVSQIKGGIGAERNKVGVPQGLAISNPLAEIFLADVDKTLRADPEIAYSRYVDDILVLCKPGTAKKVADKVCSLLEGLDLKPHRPNDEGSKSKYGPLDDAFDFLGYHVKNRQLSIREQSIHKFESSLANIFTSYRHKLLNSKSPADKLRAIEICQWRLNLRVTGCIFKGKRLGWVFYFSQITDTSRLRAVDHTVDCFISRFGLVKEIRPKRTLKTYYECRRRDKDDHLYIPNFDTLPTDQRRELLQLLIGKPGISKLADKRINELFEMKISAAVKELEQDLANAS